MQLLNKNKFIPWFLCLLLVLQGAGLYHITSVFAGDSSTSASVNNKAPTFTTIPYEDPTSSSAAPTIVGVDVTFKAIANDKNNDPYYLAVCTTAAVTPHASAAPTCDVGTWKVSGETASDALATAAYTVLQGDASSNAWYAFACDKNAASACSAVSSGSGESGTPFYVNHAPAFTVFADDAPKNPGATVTWTSTSSDSDGDNVTLYVCKTAVFTGSACTGGAWCTSSPSASDPTCGVAMPSVMQDKNWEAYGYIVDARGAISTGTAQGTDSVLTISNVAPSITAASVGLFNPLDAGGDLTLTTIEGETTGFKVKFTVTDANSCLNASAGHEIVSALINVRRSGVAAASCDATGEYNANYCYPDDYTGWTTSCIQTGTCDGAGDNTIEWECTFPFQYHADPTVTDSKFPTENWVADVKASDEALDSGWITSSAGKEMGQFMAYHLNTTAIAYGSLDPGTDATEQSTVLEATGNVGLDENLSGTILTSGSNTIAIANQHYNLTASLGWVAGTALSGTAAEAELNLGKTIATGTPLTKSTYWVLRVPDPQATGSYTGTNTIEGKVAEVVDW